jgi:hypothetical protein
LPSCSWLLEAEDLKRTLRGSAKSGDIWYVNADAAADAEKKAQGEGKKSFRPHGQHGQHQKAPAHVGPVMSSLRMG